MVGKKPRARSWSLSPEGAKKPLQRRGSGFRREILPKRGPASAHSPLEGLALPEQEFLTRLPFEREQRAPATAGLCTRGIIVSGACRSIGNFALSVPLSNCVFRLGNGSSRQS